MAVTINNREFGESTIRRVFRALDTGGTRADVRRVVREEQNRGVSNDTIRALRQAHKQVRRSMGYNVQDHGPRNLRDPETGKLRLLESLPARRKLRPSRRPRPPEIEGLRFQVQASFRDNDGADRVANFVVEEGGPSLRSQVTEAMEKLALGSPATGSTPVNPSGSFRLLSVGCNV